MSRGWRGLLLGSVLALSSAGAFLLRTWSQGEAELAASNAAFAAGELDASVRHAQRAASAFVPGAAHVPAAHARLQAIALEAERDARRELAVSAWQALRAAALESAHLWQPHPLQLALANAHLARLRGFPNAAAAGLQQAAAPAVPRALLAPGFLGALGALCWFCRCAWSGTGQWQLARAVWPALCWGVSVLVLGWALLHA